MNQILLAATIAGLVTNLLVVLTVVWRGATIITELRTENRHLATLVTETRIDHEHRLDQLDDRTNHQGERIASLEATTTGKRRP